MKAHHLAHFAAACVTTLALPLSAQQLKVERSGATVLVEPYAPNIVRVSVSMLKDEALAPAGYGISAKPSGIGWAAKQDAQGDIRPCCLSPLTAT